MIDLKLNIDLRSRLNSGQVRKVLVEIFNHNSNLVSFINHARKQMSERDLKFLGELKELVLINVLIVMN